MPTINVNRTGKGTGVISSNFNTARTSNAASVVDGPSGVRANAVQYFSSAGRGGGTKRFKRVFFHFDTSGITSELSAAHIDVGMGTTTIGDPNDTIMVKSTAFGGDGGTALATTDFFSSIDYSTAYSTELTSPSTGNNEYTLTSAALTDIENNDHFTLALIEHDNDFANSDQGDGAYDITVDFDTTITLDYTLVPTGYTHDVIGVDSSNLSKVIGIATANISKVIGV